MFRVLLDFVGEVTAAPGPGVADAAAAAGAAGVDAGLDGPAASLGGVVVLSAAGDVDVVVLVWVTVDVEPLVVELVWFAVTVVLLPDPFCTVVVWLLEDEPPDA